MRRRAGVAEWLGWWRGLGEDAWRLVFLRGLAGVAAETGDAALIAGATRRLALRFVGGGVRFPEEGGGETAAVATALGF